MAGLRARTLALGAAALLCAALASGGPAVADAPDTGRGGLPDGSKRTAVGSAEGAPATFKTYTLKGGYVAAGVGLRNRGSGTIKLTGIPKGAKVKAAYLYWTILGGDTAGSSFKKGRFKGRAITGTTIGSGETPCWASTTTGYAYRANVTSRVKGNGSYRLTRFASGTRDGSDPFTTSAPVAPQPEGASLVVVYQKCESTRTPESSSPTATAWLTDLVRCPQRSPSGSRQPTRSARFGRLLWVRTGKRISLSHRAGSTEWQCRAADWDGTDPPSPGYSQGNLWDTDTIDVIDVVKPSDTSATVSVEGGPDCLVWVAQVFSIGRNGAVDTDSDKLLDGWEANGYDANGDVSRHQFAGLRCERRAQRPVRRDGLHGRRSVLPVPPPPGSRSAPDRGGVRRSSTGEEP